METTHREIKEKIRGQSADLDFARLDHSRAERCGFPEFVFGSGKSADQLCAIVAELKKNGAPVLCTRVSADKAAHLKNIHTEAEYCAVSEVLMIRGTNTVKRPFRVGIVTAGTSDLRVAMEAKHTAEISGLNAEVICDVGVAGLHRLVASLDRIEKADVLIVIAGMEGALPSVVGGLVSCPVIAVPTSVGYGVSTGGFAALAGMLSSCASGITVVNIDNGFGAACAAVRLATLAEKRLCSSN